MATLEQPAAGESMSGAGRSLSITTTLQSAYDEQYTGEIAQWRELGAKYKAENILAVCRNRRFQRVLECGAGEGSILGFLDASGAFAELFAIEISESGIRQIEKRKIRTLRETRGFDGYQIPYPDRSFDMAYCSHVLEHVEHPRILLRELKRVSDYQVFEIPLDYAVNVDRRVRELHAYGHINVFTPSTFRFLLKSEGFDILEQRLTHSAQEVIRYNWEHNQKRRLSRKLRLYLKMLPAIRSARRWLMGAERFAEYGYSAYTCLTRSIGELRIFQDATESLSGPE